jgi:general secretion pathway protein G
MRKAQKFFVAIVACVLVLMAVLVIAAISKAREQARVTRTTWEIRQYANASTNFFAEAGRWPQAAEELVSNSMNLKFIDPAPPWKDAWGRQIVYTPFSPSKGFGSILSFGQDGRPGGKGLDADIETKFQ